jgi:hypothetical protein
MGFTHPGASLRAASAALREALAAPAGAERESKLNLALLKVAEALEITSRMWHG